MMVDKSWCDKMAQVIYITSRNILCGAAIADLENAHDHAARVVRSPVLANYQRDWRSGVLQGDDVCVETFVAALQCRREQ
jgi:hypothetical protein